MLFEYAEEESATSKVRAKSPVKENLDPARRPVK